MKCLLLANGSGIGLCSMTMNKAEALLEYKGKLLLTHIANKVLNDVGILILLAGDLKPNR